MKSWSDFIGDSQKQAKESILQKEYLGNKLLLISINFIPLIPATVAFKKNVHYVCQVL